MTDEVASLIDSLEKKAEEFDLDEWFDRTHEELRVTDYEKCCLCGKEVPAGEMQKSFHGRAEGICKKCWLFDEDTNG